MRLRAHGLPDHALHVLVLEKRPACEVRLVVGDAIWGLVGGQPLFVGRDRLRDAAEFLVVETALERLFAYGSPPGNEPREGSAGTALPPAYRHRVERGSGPVE